MQQNENIKDALYKCATGLSASETVEEFAVLDGVLTLVKKKITRRDIPPDMKAVKLLMDGSGDENLSDEELETEKQKLLKLLKESKN